MAISDLGIVNSSLIKLGVEVITALPGLTRQGIMANEQYSKVRDELIFDHPWNFAMKRVALVATATVPAFEFAYEYTLPTDFMRMWATHYGDDFYQIEGNKLYSNYSTVNIRYIAKITDPTAFSSSFAELLSTKLAADMAWSLTQSGTLKAALMEEFKMKLKDARSFDGQENPSYPLTDDIFINSRY